MTAAIFTAEDKFRPHPQMPELTAAERIVARHWDQFRWDGLPEGIDSTHVVFAQVRQGRWVVLCPACPGAQMASRSDHRFFCVHCANRAMGGVWVPVEWPDQPELIEAVLGNRPQKDTRNWLPGETIEQLMDENRDHGVAA